MGDFFLNYIITNACIPGKIESWVCVFDLKDVGVTEIPKDRIQGLVKTMNKKAIVSNLVINVPSASLVAIPAKTYLKTMRSGSIKQETNSIIVLSKGVTANHKQGAFIK